VLQQADKVLDKDLAAAVRVILVEQRLPLLQTRACNNGDAGLIKM
jgi:hypothetical protein